MTIGAGTRLGHYEIRSQIGAGGMGEVYLAQDTKLDRRVAVKILPANVARNQERMRRFVQEAKAAAALNHPNIAHIYEVGEADGMNFIAMEFIDGHTLRELIHGRQTDLAKLLRYLQHAAEGLAKAHAAGIVHRDLKPDNIMVTRDGHAKILDFGLVKLLEHSRTILSDEQMSVATTVAMRPESEPGLVIGTVGYMSPEQAQGKTTEIDHRSDIFSFGCILFETVTAHRPFEAESKIKSLHKVVYERAPSIKGFTPSATSDLERIVRRCLAKDPEDRYQTIKDVAIELKELRREMEGGGIEATTPPPPVSGEVVSTQNGLRSTSPTGSGPTRTYVVSTTPPTSSAEYIVNEIKRHKIGVAALAVVIVAAIALAYAFYRFAWNPKPAVAHFQNIKLTRVTTEGYIGSVTMSPDGKYIAYVLVEGGKRSLWTKHLATGSRVQIAPPIEEGYMPPSTFSRDGSYVYYVLTNEQYPQGVLYQVPVLGGPPKKILTNVDGPISLSPDDKQFVFKRFHTGAVVEDELLVANADGSNEHRLTSSQFPEWLSDLPAWSPDGRLIAVGYGTSEGGYHMELAVVSVVGGTLKQITSQRWFDVGRVAWFSGGSGLITNDLNSYAYGWLGLTADDSALVALQVQFSSNIWIEPEGDAGRARAVTFRNNLQQGGSGLAWTPDGKVIYETNINGKASIWLMNADGGDAKPLTDSTADDQWPQVSPDGRYIIFISLRTKSPEVWRMEIDGANPKQLTNSKEAISASISPDGRWIVYSTYAGNIWKVSIDGGTPVKLSDKALAYFSQVSADGKLLAYSSLDEQTKRPKIVIIPFEGGAPVKTFDLPVSSSQLFYWSADGSSFVFAQTVLRVSNLWRQALHGGKPVQITDFKSDVISNFAYSRDGRQLALSRGTWSSDAVLISDVK